MEDPLLCQGGDPSLWDPESWWRGADYDALQDDPSWFLSNEGRQYQANRQQELENTIDNKVHVKSRWEELMEEEDVLECMVNMFLKAEEEAEKAKNSTKEGKEVSSDPKDH